MLSLEGKITCRVYEYEPGLFWIYIKAEELGIEPGEVNLRIDNFLRPFRDNYVDGDWFIKLYSDSVFRGKKKKHRKSKRIPYRALIKSTYYNEILRVDLSENYWFTQEVKASILLPLIKERSKVPNSLVYVDEYWRI